MFNSNAMPYSMPVTPMVTNGGFGGDIFGGNGGGLWFLIIILVLFGGWGNGGWNGASGANRDYVLTSDFSQLSKQISDTYNMTDRKFEGIANGICNLGYTEQNLINGVNQNITQNGFESRLATQNIGSQLASCCCDIKQQIGDVNYANAMNANAIQKGISDGFCQTNFNNSNNTRDIITSTHTDTDRIIARLDAMESSRQAERIAELQNQNQALRLQASQTEQNAYLISQLKPCPSPAYVVPNPYCNCNCNNNLYGTTIA